MSARSARKPTVEREGNPVADAVEKAIREAKGDRAAAIRILEARVRHDATLREQILEPMIRRACEDAIGGAIRRDRRSVWTGPKPVDASAQRDRVIALASGNLLMFRLPTPGNKPLGESTRTEVMDGVRFYEAQSRDMGVKARWLTLVAQHVTDGKLVRSVLSEDRLQELQREASRAE